MSAFVEPLAMCFSTSISRLFRSDGIGHVLGEMNCSTIRPVTPGSRTAEPATASRIAVAIASASASLSRKPAAPARPDGPWDILRAATGRPPPNYSGPPGRRSCADAVSRISGDTRRANCVTQRIAAGSGHRARARHIGEDRAGGPDLGQRDGACAVVGGRLGAPAFYGRRVGVLMVRPTTRLCFGSPTWPSPA
jgi:hypothetical protein